MRLDIELFFDPLDHGYGAFDLGGSMSWRWLHVHDHTMLDINQSFVE